MNTAALRAHNLPGVKAVLVPAPVPHGQDSLTKDVRAMAVRLRPKAANGMNTAALRATIHGGEAVQALPAEGVEITIVETTTGKEMAAPMRRKAGSATSKAVLKVMIRGGEIVRVLPAEDARIMRTETTAARETVVLMRRKAGSGVNRGVSKVMIHAEVTVRVPRVPKVGTKEKAEAMPADGKEMGDHAPPNIGGRMSKSGLKTRMTHAGDTVRDLRVPVAGTRATLEITAVKRAIILVPMIGIGMKMKAGDGKGKVPPGALLIVNAMSKGGLKATMTRDGNLVPVLPGPAAVIGMRMTITGRRMMKAASATSTDVSKAKTTTEAVTVIPAGGGVRKENTPTLKLAD